MQRLPPIHSPRGSKENNESRNRFLLQLGHRMSIGVHVGCMSPHIWEPSISGPGCIVDQLMVIHDPAVNS
jgi:hypothetical protein